MKKIKNQKKNVKASRLSSAAPGRAKTKPVKRRRLKHKSKNKGHSRAFQPCGGCLVILVLSGEMEALKRYFFYMLGKGWFCNVREHYQSEIGLFLDDVFSEVYLSLYKDFVNGTLGRITHAKSFIFKTIKYQSIREDKHLARFIRYDFFREEEKSND